MATEQQIKKFIAEIAPCAQNGFKMIGKVLPSVCIGMACVECGYGTAGSVRHHSYLGQKVGTGKTATKYWDGKFFTASTKEEYVVGQHTTISNAAFRAYDSLQQCVLNYYELLNTRLYSRVQSGVDYVKQMQQIKLCGYMTSSTEVASVIRIIQKYGLTQYDHGDAAPVQPEAAYVPGKVYVLQSDLYVRDKPEGTKLKFDALTQDGKKNGFFDAEGCAILRKGTRITCKAVSGNWMMIPSGWVCIKNSKGVYII